MVKHIENYIYYCIFGQEKGNFASKSYLLTFWDTLYMFAAYGPPNSCEGQKNCNWHIHMQTLNWDSG